MGLFKRKNKEVQTAPQINLPGIKLPTLQYNEASAMKKLDKLNMDSLETAQNKTMRYQTRATQDVSLEDMATRLGIDSNQLLEWNQGADQGFKQGDIINLNLTNDQGRALMKSVDELRAENERRAAERQEYANRDDVKQYGFMRGLTGKQVMNTFRTQKDFDNEKARVKHNTAVESDIIANDQRQAVRNRRDWGPMQFEDGTSELTSKQFVGDIQDAMNTAGEYGLKFSGTVGGAMALPTLVADLGLQPILRLGYNLGKDMIFHPIQNIVAPQLASKGIETGIDLTNEAGLTDISDKNKELISTYGGFSLGGLGVGAAKNYISRQMLNKGMGAMFESGSESLASNILKNQLESKYMSLAQAGVNPQALANAGSSAVGDVAKQQLKNVRIWSGTNFLNYGVPTLAPGLGQYASYNYNNKSLGENLENLTGIDSAVGDFVAEGLLGSAGQAYKHGLAYTQASMSGGKKGFWNNWNYFWDNAGRTEADLKFTDKHPILGKFNSVRRMLTLNPGENNYQMAVTETTGKGHGSTNYRPEENSQKSPLKYVRYWFSGNSDDLGGKLERRGQIMLGNRDTSTGNPLEKLVKSVGVNDGRFENGQIASIVTTPGAATEEILANSHFLNMRSQQFEPMFLESGEINPNLRFGVTGSRNNTLLADATKNASGTHTGTMLDIDGHMEIPIRTKDGKMMYVAVDTTGPGSGGKGGGVGTKIMSNTTSREQKPAFSVTISGERRLHGNPDSFGVRDVDKIMAPVTEANTDRNFVLTLENMDNANVKAMFGNTPEYQQLAAYRSQKQANVRRAVEEANRRSPRFTWFGKDKPHPFKVEQNIDPKRVVSLRSQQTGLQSRISSLQTELQNGVSGKTQKKLTQKQISKKQELISQLQRKNEDLERAINFVQNQDQSRWSLDYWKNRRAYSRTQFNTTRAKTDIYTGAKKHPELVEPAHRGIQVSYKQGGKIGINQIGI